MRNFLRRLPKSLRPAILRSRGQSLVEFAIILPVLLLLVAGAIDLGRAYFTSISLENAVKEGAFFGARDPECATDATVDCDDPTNVEARVDLELDGQPITNFQAKCFAAGSTVFTGPGKALADCVDGDLYYVRAESPFNLITPIIANIVGSTITLASDASAVVVTSFERGTGEVTFPSDAPTPTPAPGTCTVPDFTLGPTKIRDADDVWSVEAGFTLSNLTTIGGNNQDISWQSVSPGTVGSCTTQTITVSNTPQTTPTPTPSPTPTPTPGPTATATPTPPGATPTPTPNPNCTVPTLTGFKITVAQARWVQNGFTAANFSAVRPPNSDYDVVSQSIPAGSSRPCLTTTVSVDN